MSFLKACLLILMTLGLVQPASARYLGPIPFDFSDNINIDLDVKSDLWTNLKSYKQAPMRFMAVDLKIPIIRSQKFDLSFLGYSDYLSVGQATIDFGDRAINFDSALISQQYGLQGSYRFNNKNRIYLRAYVRSESDQPFMANRDKWLGATAVYSFEKKEGDRWFAALDFDRNRGIANDKIFPYFGKFVEFNEKWSAIIAFPYLLVTYGDTMANCYSFHLSPFSSYLETQRQFLESYNLRLRAEVSLQSYLLADREIDTDRLYFQQASVSANLSKAMTDVTRITYGLGYAFDRRIYYSHELYHPAGDMFRATNDFFVNIGLEFHL